MNRVVLNLSLCAALLTSASGQTVFTESFTGTTAAGWTFGGNYTPNLTANTIDTPGDGWLRLTDNAINRATYALLDTQIFSVNAKIDIKMDYAFYNGTGADGISFFLVDGGTTAASFDPGSYGGSLGYAQRTGEGGMVGGYLGFGLDNFGNYSNPTEGRVGGTGAVPNAIAVRGPESSNYAFINGSGALAQEMDFPGLTTRPDQTGADFRSFQIILDANNQLNVLMKFGASGAYTSVFTADLSAYDRPETFKLGFTGATGGSTEIHEVRNLTVTTTPWSSGSGAYEWDNGAGNTAWGTTAGSEANTNWFSAIPGDDNKTPVRDSDILFGNKPPAGPQTVNLANNVEVRNMTFDTGYDYTLQGPGTITMGDTGKPGLPSINVNNYNDSNGRHKINNDITLAEELRINNYSFSTLCLNGTMETGGNDIKINGYGAVNFNGDISGSGDMVKNGKGITTINNDNSDNPAGAPTAWSGNVTINEGLLVVTANGALGNTTGTTAVNNGGTLAFRATDGASLNYSITESVTIAGRGVERGSGQSAGAIYNDGGNNSFAGAITLAANAAVGSRDGVLTLSGVIGDGASTYNLTKVGEGVVSLTGTNTYGGNTIVEAGVLRVTTGSLPGGYDTSNTGADYGAVNLAGGVLELASGTNFTRSVGTGEEQIFWSGDGGFSASGGDRTVTLSGGTMTWGSGSFVPTGNALLLSSNYSDATTTFSNAIALGSAQREVRVANGSAALDGVLSGVLSGTGGINKTGAGTVELSANNTYTGTTQISDGALRVGNANRINGSDLILNGGVLEISGDLDTSNAGDFTRTLGTTGGDDVRWTSDGGFAASGANREVRLNNGTAAVTWGGGTPSSGFVGGNNSFILGSVSSANTVTLANDLVLGGNSSETRTIRTVQGTSSTVASGTLSGVVSGAANLAVIGTGRLDVTANNTQTGAVTISGSELRISGANGDLAQSSGFTVNNGGTLTLDNVGAINTDRIGNTAGITLNGGSFTFLGNSSFVLEDVGVLTLAGGSNTVTSTSNGTDADLRFTSLAPRAAGSTLDVVRNTTSGNVRFNTSPTYDDNILAYATITNTGAGSVDFVGRLDAFPGYVEPADASYLNTGAQSTWTTTATNATTGTSQTLTAARTINSLKLSNGADITQAGFALTLQSGGLLTSGSGNGTTISGGTLTTGSSNELIVHAYNTVGTDISSTITGSGGLTKAGSGTLTLSGTTANTFTGTTYVNDGTLLLNKTANVTALAGNVVVGDGRGADKLEFAAGANNQLAFSSDVSLIGGLTGLSATNANQATLKLNGTTQTFDQLTITGNSVIDFSGGDPCAPTFLNISDINFVGDATLTIKNWIEFTDFFLVKSDATIDFSRIKFEGYGGQAQWQDYSSGWKQIVPVPEPSTYGAIFLGGVSGFMLLRRRRRA